MEVDIVLILYLANALSPIVGFVAYFVVIENVPRQNHFVFAYLVICFLADGFSYFKMLPGPVIANVHDICQFFVVIIIYTALLKQRGTLILATVICLYLIGIITTSALVGIGGYQNYMWALSGLLLSIICIVYLNTVNVLPNEFAANSNIHNTLVMNASFLFYFLSTFVLFLLVDWIIEKTNTEMIRITWTYHNALGFVKNIGLAVAIFLTGKAKALETAPGE
jgi:hypothetical protein